jgi:hypothetical protein
MEGSSATDVTEVRNTEVGRGSRVEGRGKRFQV